MQSMYKIQFLVLEDLNDVESELFDRDNLHDPQLDHKWIDWSTHSSYHNLADELISDINNNNIDDGRCYWRLTVAKSTSDTG